MKKNYLLLLLLAMSFQAFATYNFSAVAPSGQTLYYKILSSTNHTVGIARNASNQPSGHLVIPSTVSYRGVSYRVTSLICEDMTGTFEDDTMLTSVVIPSSVTSLGNYSFWQCYNLTSVVLPDTMNSIGEACFCYCSALTDIRIPVGITTITSFCFEYDSSLSSVVLPNTIDTIETNAFHQCTRLATINLPESIRLLNLSCFDSCISLTSIVIPSDLSFCSAKVFWNCKRLKTVFYNATNLNKMGGAIYAASEPDFGGCDSLETIHIGSNVTSLPQYCFYGCSSIRDIYCHATTPPTWRFTPSWGTTKDTTIFYGVDSATVHIPCGSGILSSYQTEWSPMNTFVQQPLYDISYEANDTAAGTVELTTAPTCAAPQATLTASANEGYRFHHWSNGEITNTLTFTVTQDTHFVAYFTHLYNVVANSNDSTRGYATGEGVYDEGTEVVVEAFPYEGYRFVNWSNGDTANPTTVVLTSDTVMMASFETIQYTVTAETNDPTMGSVTGAGIYNYGTTVTLEAVPNEGYQFVNWSNGDTINLLTFIPTSDTSFTATFEPLPVGIDEVDGHSYTIATQGLSVIIRGAADEQLTIYDVTGRVLVSERCEEGRRYTMPAMGVYMVKVGCSTPKKVIVTH